MLRGCRLEQRAGQLASVGQCQGVLVAEHFEDIEHCSASLVLERTLVANDQEETVKRRLELRAGGERLGEFDPQLLVVGIRSESRFEIREVMATRCLEAGGRLEPVDFGVRNETSEHDESFVCLAAVDQQ